MLKRYCTILLLLALTACESYDLTKKNFPICAKPFASIGYSVGQLDVTFFLENIQGDITVAGWDPGDGKNRSRVGQRVTYVYDKPGTYTVTLVVTNTCDDKLVMTRSITVHN